MYRAGIVSGSGPSAFSRGGPARGSKRKRGEKDPNMLLPGPVVKHHHSVIEPRVVMETAAWVDNHSPLPGGVVADVLVQCSSNVPVPIFEMWRIH